MRLSISNIAWPLENDCDVARVLNEHEIQGIEVAPTKMWPSPLEATLSEIREYRQWWKDRGIQIIAAQSLLYGRPDLTIFEDAHKRGQAFAYLEGIVQVAAELGAKALVFGSPKNRRIGRLLQEEVRVIALDFFGALGDSAARAGVAICLEANPVEYGADFVTSAHDAVTLVKKANNPGFRLHLDSGCMTLSGDPVHEVMRSGSAFLWHFHISEPYLGQIGSGTADHNAFAQGLHSIGYSGWISVEMRMRSPFSLESIVDAICTANSFYRDQF
jgi:D-psicose/D-tagatose/L-ribulose 3-epimerase